MSNYQDTVTWKKLLGNRTENIAECNRLQVEFEKFRDKARLLGEEIATILPELTVHNITHIDALWEMADVILPEDYPLNPAECFVLGGAFLLHDLGMIVAAYPERMKGIHQENIWKDTVAKLYKQKGVPFDPKASSAIDLDIEKAATEKTLRVLHAKKARELAKMPLCDEQKNTHWLIDDETLRAAYGTVIGQIAESHWLNCEELPNRFTTTLGALPCFPGSWSIDPLKLACIVRLADAMHIDDRRAPAFLNAIRDKTYPSQLHWTFQEKLNRPRIEHNRVVYTSKSPFGLDDIDAWWLCYDTLKMIDKELKSVDSLLREHGRKPFQAVGIYGIDNLEQIQRTITVVDWKPIDTSIRVNNVAKLVSTLGGTQLYGNNYLVPLRELIQNAADAVRARRCIDDEDDGYGNIMLSFGEENGVEYIQVEDNGIGMSPNVLVNVLLDFGQSFWSSEQMHEEFPGLEQKPFQSTGKFGIGFFSVFMWGERVKVISNRFDRGRDDTSVLEFINGVNGRPILRKAHREEQIKNGGTRITVWLSEKNLQRIFSTHYVAAMSPSEIIAKLCFALDCDLYLNDGTSTQQLVRANDWQTMPAEDFLCRLLGCKRIEQIIAKTPDIYKLLCSNLSLFKEEDGSVVGRGCLYADERFYDRLTDGIVTIDGFEALKLTGIVGVLKGITKKASRDTAIPIVSQKTLDKWVAEQAQLLISRSCTDEMQLRIAKFGHVLTKKATPLKIAQWKNQYVNYSQIVEIVKTQNCDSYVLVQDGAVRILEDKRWQKIDLVENVFVCDMGRAPILRDGDEETSFWPEKWLSLVSKYSFTPIEQQIINAIAEGWGCSVEHVIEKAQFFDDDLEYSAVIGYAGGEPIEETVDIIHQPET